MPDQQNGAVVGLGGGHALVDVLHRNVLLAFGHCRHALLNLVGLECREHIHHDLGHTVLERAVCRPEWRVGQRRAEGLRLPPGVKVLPGGRLLGRDVGVGQLGRGNVVDVVILIVDVDVDLPELVGPRVLQVERRRSGGNGREREAPGTNVRARAGTAAG